MRRVKASLALGVGAAFAAAFGVGTNHASAISEGNSTIETTLPAGSAFSTWRIDGVDHVFTTQYWIRVGDGPADLIQSLDFAGQLGGDDMDDFVTGRWNDPDGRFMVDVNISTVGGNPAVALVNIDVLKNPQATQILDLPISIYEYTDMDLNADAPDDSLSITGGNDVVQTDGGTVYEQNSVPQPASWQGLDGSAPTDLGALFSGALSNSNAAPVGGDQAFAFQWSFVLDSPTVPGSEQFQLSITKSIRTGVAEVVIPEPATTALGMLGMSALASYLGRRRRQA